MAERQRDAPAGDDDDLDPRHQARRGRPRADRRARRAARTVWADALDRLLSLAPLPDPGFGNLLWQAVVGAWPASRERLHAYAEKAMREAGDRTTWTEPDATYESAVHAAVDAAFDDPDGAAMLDDLLARVAGPGWSNAVSAKLIALTMPGVPDVYQGSELWEQSPRRPRQPASGRLRRTSRPARPGPRRRAPRAHTPRRRPRSRQAAGHPGRAHPASEPAAPLHDVRPGRDSRRGRGSRPRLRPRRRDHGRHPTPRGTGRARLGRHDAVAPRRRLGGPADRTRVRRCRASSTTCWPTTRSRC